jgi:hypothetical protein
MTSMTFRLSRDVVPQRAYSCHRIRGLPAGFDDFSGRFR